MSEYQYYEFRAVDRDLTQKEMGQLRRLSTRAEITPRSFTNFYTFGDFKGDPRRMVERYFDAFVYVANWGTHILALRLPRLPIDVKAAKRYCTGEELALRVKKPHVILEFDSQREDRDFDEGDGWIDLLVPLREELIEGDFRSLYLGWLIAVDSGALDDEILEPPVPPGLNRLSPAQAALVEFLGIDVDLVAAAAESGAPEGPTRPSREQWAQWIGELPEADKNALLVQVIEGNGKQARSEMLGRFREDRAKSGCTNATGADRRTIGQLLALRTIVREERLAKAARRRTAGGRRKNRKLAAARGEVLDFLAGHAAEHWDRVEEHVRGGSARCYEKAVRLLEDLRSAMAKAGREEEFAARLHQLCACHARKRSFIQRLTKAKLTGKRGH